MRRRFVMATVLLVIAYAALMWRPVVAPALVKFPADVDETLRYEGTALVYFDLATGSQLPKPHEEPLSITRRLRTTGDQGANTVILTETITTKLGATTQVDRHQYVMNRRSMTFKNDDRNWAYSPSNRVDRSGFYRVNLPMDLESDTNVAVWNNETSTAYRAVKAGEASQTVGLKTFTYAGQIDNRPVTDGMAAVLAKGGFPAALPIETVAPGALAALETVLRPADAAIVVPELSKGIPLRYSFSFRGQIAADPKVGAIVDLRGVDEWFSVKPDVSGLAATRAVLASYSDARVAQLVGTLGFVGGIPAQRVLELRYNQTPASVRDAVDTARSAGDLKTLVEERVPAALAALVLVLVVTLTVSVYREQRRKTAMVIPLPRRTAVDHRAAA